MKKPKAKRKRAKPILADITPTHAVDTYRDRAVARLHPMKLILKVVSVGTTGVVIEMCQQYGLGPLQTNRQTFPVPLNGTLTIDDLKADVTVRS